MPELLQNESDDNLFIAVELLSKVIKEADTDTIEFLISSLLPGLQDAVNFKKTGNRSLNNLLKMLQAETAFYRLPKH